MKIVVNIILCV